MKQKKLKMFIWEKVLADWTSGIMVAYAYDVNEARRLLKEQIPNNSEMDCEPTKVYDSPGVAYCYGGS